MCGIAGRFGKESQLEQVEVMVKSQQHRGPDASGMYLDPQGFAALGHNRLSIIDLSEAGRQPMSDATGRYWIVFNGEIYNYLELRRQLESEYRFRTATDTEVLLAAYERWGEGCLERFIGMFSFLIWDQQLQELFAARDRFGVKPLYYHQTANQSLLIASEIKALHAAGITARPNVSAWATYLALGVYDHSEETFWQGIHSLPAGHVLRWKNGCTTISRWYDLIDRVGTELDRRPLETVWEEYLSLLTESVRFRFRADVPVGINLSGGLDSCTLLGLVQKQDGSSNVKAFTFTTGDPKYDELPWVREMLAHTQHESLICSLDASDVPQLAESVQRHQDEPFGGVPTLAYARLFECARQAGVIVLLDGQGMDEQWAGYDYYKTALNGCSPPIVQGSKQTATKPECLLPEFVACAKGLDQPRWFSDQLRNLQYRDARYTKIPRALRFNDRVSMRVSTELREPFLDHRLFELALAQPAERKISGGIQKVLLREITRQLLPQGVVEAPKRPVQTPQREWLRGPLRAWASDNIERALSEVGGAWLDRDSVRKAWSDYNKGESDNSFYIWQWINLGLML